jgi:hypothetical protein
MDPASRARVEALQARIDAVLKESLEESAASAFSDYLPGGSTDLQSQLWTAPATGRIEDIEGILDRFDGLRASQDPIRLRYALSVVLTHHPTVAAAGLRLPSLEERSPWKVRPRE